ncbi:MAG: GDP-mannose pyrophosphatase NudK [Saprospiraceae bacterium]|nr:GDP-mannose pyrophosphatase NudK [Saprospiraceae bacterium]
MNPRVRNVQKHLLSDNWYKLYRVSFEYQKKNGDWEAQNREAYDRGNGAGILLYNRAQRTVILTRQFRMPTFVNGNETGLMIEVCAGLLEENNAEECIRRETEEETGYKVSDVQKVLELYMSPGSVTEILHLFVAEYTKEQKITEGGGLEHEEEEIDVLEIPFAQALEMVKTKEIKDAKTVLLLQYAQIHLGLS